MQNATLQRRDSAECWVGSANEGRIVTMRNLFLTALVVIAAAAKAIPPTPPELARTTWRWVSLTTPEETLTIAEPERYTLRFSDGDRVALRADCNHGAGSVASRRERCRAVGQDQGRRRAPGHVAGRLPR